MNSIRQLVDDDDEDDVEKVSWSGEPVGSKCLVPWRILSCDWLQADDPCLLRPQVFPGPSKRRRRPIRGQTKSPPSPRSPQRGRRSTRASPGSPWAPCSKVRTWRGACWVETMHNQSWCGHMTEKKQPGHVTDVYCVCLQERVKEETCRASLTVSVINDWVVQWTNHLKVWTRCCVLALGDPSVRLFAPELRKPKSEYKVTIVL